MCRKKVQRRNHENIQILCQEEKRKKKSSNKNLIMVVKNPGEPQAIDLMFPYYCHKDAECLSYLLLGPSIIL